MRPNVAGAQQRDHDHQHDHQAIPSDPAKIGPRNGARVVARAWVDPAYKQRLLTSASAAIAEFGYSGMEGEQMVVVENTDKVHNLVVCTLCSCYPWPVLGLPPVWYKSAAYRSRSVIARMNGIHDMGGMQDMGPIRPEKDEPVFHAAWEGRAFAMDIAVDGDWPEGSGRFQRESIPPEDYLRMSYYDKWATGLQQLLEKSGMVTQQEIESGVPNGGRNTKAQMLTAAEVGPMDSSPPAQKLAALPHLPVDGGPCS